MADADKDVSGKAVSGRTGATRRAFLSASAVTAVTVPLLGGTAVAAADLPAGGQQQQPDKELRDLLRQVDPERIKATILRLGHFWAPNTGSQPDRSGARDRRRHQLGVRADAGRGGSVGWADDRAEADVRPAGVVGDPG